MIVLRINVRRFVDRLLYPLVLRSWKVRDGAFEVCVRFIERRENFW